MTLDINTLGSAEDRARWREALVAHFTAHEALLDDDDARRRLDTNPLRILDTKNPDMQDLVRGRPEARRTAVGRLARALRRAAGLLRAAGIDARVNPRLVRGLDYYSHTVFEWGHRPARGPSPGCAGAGRYDDLVQAFGAKGGAGVGWALGMERVVARSCRRSAPPPRRTPRTCS